MLNGLRKRPQMEEIVNYLQNGQETVKYTDRQAKFIRNHPFMTQFDFFEIPKYEESQLEEQIRHQRAQELARDLGQLEHL